MARRLAPLLLTALLGALLSGCAVGPKLDEVFQARPGPPQGQARIFFYRPIDAFLIGRDTEFVVNDRRVGLAISGAVFFRDALPGGYRIHTVDDTQSVVFLQLEAGDIAYIRAQSQRGNLGFGVGAVLAEPEVGERESARLVYSDGRTDEEEEAGQPRYLLPQRVERGER